MTARVHAHMRLGVLPSGDFSFDAPDAVVELDTRDEHLCITVLSPKFELEIGDGQRTRELTVSPQTHIRLEFLGHLLDIDNDFAVPSPAGEALEIYVVREGQPRVLPESVKLPQKSSAQIIVAEQFAGGRLSGMAAQQVEQARADEQPVVERRSGVRRLAGALAGSALIIFTLVVVALNVAERSNAPVAPSGTESATDSVTLEPVVPEVVAGAGPDVLARFAALVEMEPLPDRATIDFAVESLKSLRIAYPEDPGVPAALSRLSERLVVEARVAYDLGDAFLAGRLIEQAAAIGPATASVDETLAYFAAQPPGSAAVAQPSEGPAPAAKPETYQQSQVEVLEPDRVVPDRVEPETVESAVEPVQAIARAQVPAAPAQASESDELDQLVESATGIALGALAVDMTITDTPAAGAVLSAALGPTKAAAPEVNDQGVAERVQSALDSYLDGVRGERPVAASELPAGFAEEDTVRRPLHVPSQEPVDALVGRDGEQVPSGPIFRPFSELTITEQEPLTYPRRALDGAEGSVEVEFIVTETGTVSGLRITGDAPAVFIQEAARAIRQWRFQPVLVNGTAVAVQTGLRVTFRG